MGKNTPKSYGQTQCLKITQKFLFCNVRKGNIFGFFRHCDKVGILLGHFRVKIPMLSTYRHFLYWDSNISIIFGHNWCTKTVTKLDKSFWPSVVQLLNCKLYSWCYFLLVYLHYFASLALMIDAGSSHPNRMIRFIKQYSHFSRPLQCQSTVRPKKRGHTFSEITSVSTKSSRALNRKISPFQLKSNQIANMLNYALKSLGNRNHLNVWQYTLGVSSKYSLFPRYCQLTL